MNVPNRYCVHCDRVVQHPCNEAQKLGCELHAAFETEREARTRGGRLNGPDDKALAARELAAAVPYQERGGKLNGPDETQGCMADFDKAETERRIRDALNGGPLKNNEPPKLKPNPADEPYTYVEPDKPTVTDAVLLHYGYAPGDYVLRCKDCQELKQGNSKRNQRCRECAEKRYWHDANAKMAEPPREGYEPPLGEVRLGVVTITYTEYSQLKVELAEAVKHRGEALNFGEQWKADCLKAWARIEELQKRIIAYDKQVEALRSKR